MPRILPLLAFLCATGKAFATLYTGSFTVTLTEVQDMSEYPVGYTFINSFQYESNAMDGTFYYSAGGGIPADANTSLEGQIFWAFPSSYDYKVMYSGDEIFKGYHSFGSGPGSYGLTVEGGVVTDFRWITDFGSFTVYITEIWYSTSLVDTFYEDANGAFLGSGPNPSTLGTMSFSAIETVPDGAPTIALLSISMIGLVAFRRRFAS